MAKHIFTGVFIPAKIWLHKDLIPQEKMMLGEIKALSEETGWCFANNKHFADWLCCGVPNVSNYIKKFQERGMIEVKYKDLKTFSGRKIRVNLEWYHSLPAPFTGNEAPFTGNEAPFTGNEAPFTGNETERQFKNTSILSEREHTPAENFNNLEAEKKERGLVAPGRDASELLTMRISEEDFQKSIAIGLASKKVAPKGSSPDDCPDCLGTGTVNDEFCFYCGGSGNFTENSGLNTTREFNVTAIASPTDIPGVTLVEAAPGFAEFEREAVKENREVWAKIAPRRNGRIEIPDEAAAEIMPWANGDGAQTVKVWYERAFRRWSPSDVETMVLRFSTVFLSSPTASTRDMMETNPLSFFKRRFSKFVADQPSFDRLNAPKEGVETRNGNGQPAKTITSNMRQL